MAVYTYTANNISFASFDSWFNSYGGGHLNYNLGEVLQGKTPADTAPYQASEIRSNAYLYGSVVAGTGGTVSVTSGYTQAAAASFTLQNVDFGAIASVTVTATATYPYTFHSFRTASGVGGTVLSSTGQGTTTGTITLSSGVHTGVSTFYAYFTSTHVSP
jgi:hypothetical protein